MEKLITVTENNHLPLKGESTPHIKSVKTTAKN